MYTLLSKRNQYHYLKYHLLNVDSVLALVVQDGGTEETGSHRVGSR